MARPKKERRIFGIVKCRNFVPVNGCIEYISLSRDEFEALKLKDFNEMDQEHAALKMKVSQSTFHRILLKGRKKVSDALINGKEIVING